MFDQPSVITANGVEICVQTRGERGDPPILLIHGAAASMYGWPDEFYEDLARAGNFVIRYDHRDTGQSVSYPPGAPPYDLRDLTADAVGILDALDLGQAHIVGISMGGGIAQIMGIEHPDRVASLTLMATSPGGPDLPPPSDAFLNVIQNRPDPDWSNHEAVIEHALGMMRAFSATLESHQESLMRRMLEQDIQRSTVHPASMQANHFMIDPGNPVGPRLSRVTAPSLIIHGAEDPVFPIVHAEKLSAEIPGAELITLDGVGHLIPWEAPETVLAALSEHCERAGV